MSDTSTTVTVPAPDGYDAAYAAKLWALLPALYRTADAPGLGETGPLQELLNRVATQMAVVRRSIDRLWEDQSVESCDDWVVPYIADLLATNLVSGMDARGQRLDVANTIDYRRRKGTLGLIEQLSADITGWDARAVEMFRRLGRRRHMLGPAIGWPSTGPGAVPARQLQQAQGLVGLLSGTPIGGRADLRNVLGATNTAGPFDEMAHRADVRFGQGALGWYGISKLGVFLWRHASIPSGRTTPVVVSGCSDEDHYCFDPTGRQVALWAPQSRSSSSYGQNWVSPSQPQLPGPISQLLYDAVQASAGQPLPQGAYPPPASFWPSALSVSALDAGYPLGQSSVEVWPEVGRFAVPAGGGVETSYYFGLFSPIGAGAYDRRQPGVPAAVDPSPVITLPEDPSTSPAALADALVGLAPTGTVVIPTGLTWSSVSPLGETGGAAAVTIRAAASTRAVLRLAPGGAWVIYGASGTEAPATVRLEGLLTSGQDIIFRGSFAQVTLSCCTVDPGSAGDLADPPTTWATAVDGTPLGASHIYVEGDIACLELDRCICGPVRTRAGGVIEQLCATSSIIQGLASNGGGVLSGVDEVFDVTGFIGALVPPPPPEGEPPQAMSPLSAQLSSQLLGISTSPDGTDLVSMLNDVITGDLVYTPALFSGVELSAASIAALASPPTGEALVALNRQLLAEAYPVYLLDAAIVTVQGVVNLNCCSVMGDAHVHRLMCSNSILAGDVLVEDTQDGCVRFSASQSTSTLPRQYESVSVAPGTPFFVSQRYGEAFYGELGGQVDDFITGASGLNGSIAAGAGNGSEMGAFCAALAPVKERSLLVKYNEYMPVGVTPVLVHVPSPDPDGEKERALPWP